MAELLDNNEDGIVGDAAVNAALIESRASMYLVDEFDKFSKFDMGPDSPMHNFGVTVGQHSGETNVNGSECGPLCSMPHDVSLEELLHLIQLGGYSHAHPAFASVRGSLLVDAMDTARGGYFVRAPNPYPPWAWCIRKRPSDAGNDDAFNYLDHMQEYLYWGLTTFLGVPRSSTHCTVIVSEWKLCTEAEFRATDTKFCAFITNPEYRLPAKLPDGVYPARVQSFRQSLPTSLPDGVYPASVPSLPQGFLDPGSRAIATPFDEDTTPDVDVDDFFDDFEEDIY